MQQTPSKHASPLWHWLVAVQAAPDALLKAADTERTPRMLTVQVPLPVHEPDQPVKTEPASAVAVSTTSVDAEKLAEQLVPQLMPAGDDVIVPLPAPLLLTVNE